MHHLALLALGLATAAPAQTQYVAATSSPDGTTTIFTVTPQVRLAAADYVKLNADALNYRIAADRLAATRAQRDDVKNFARASLDAAQRQQGTLMASLSNADRKIARPSTKLSSARQASLDLLRKAPRGSFDTLYLQQVTDDAPSVWALNKGYALDGADQPLRNVAAATVPSIEAGYTAAKNLLPAGVVQ